MPGPGEADTSIYKPLQFVNPLQTAGTLLQLQEQQQNLAAQRGKAFAAAGYALLEQHGKNPDGLTHKHVNEALNQLISAGMLPSKAAAEMAGRLKNVPEGRALFGQIQQFSDATLGAVEAQGLAAARRGQLNVGDSTVTTNRGIGQDWSFNGGQPGAPIQHGISPETAIQTKKVLNPDGSESEVPINKAFPGNPVVSPAGRGGVTAPPASAPKGKTTIGSVADIGADTQSGKAKPFGNPGGPAAGTSADASGGLKTKPAATVTTNLESDLDYLKGVKTSADTAASTVANVDHIERDLLPTAIQGPGSSARTSIIRLGEAFGLDAKKLEATIPLEFGKGVGSTEALKKAYDQLAVDYLKQAFPNDRNVSDKDLSFSANVNPNIDMTKEGATAILQHIRNLAKLKLAENVALQNAVKRGKDLTEFRTQWTTTQRKRIWEKIKAGEYDPTAGAQ